MRKSFGNRVVIDTNPPYKPWDGNQATYLFFPVFTAFVLTILSGLSSPIIDGLYMVQIDTKVNGTMNFGTWGFCVKGAPGVDDFCSGERHFGGNLTDLEALPAGMASLAEAAKALPGSYLIATGVFHLLGALAAWVALVWTLAASGAWHNKDPNGWGWTRFSHHCTGASALVILIAWALDLGMFTRVAAKATNVDGSQPSVRPGPAIWLMMVSFLACFITYLVCLFYLRRLPRPSWSLKGAGDFHEPHGRPPLSAALPPPEEHPPTWDSLDLNTPVPRVDKGYQGYTAEEEKRALEEMERSGRMGYLEAALREAEKPSVEQRGFTV